MIKTLDSQLTDPLFGMVKEEIKMPLTATVVRTTLHRLVRKLGLNTQDFMHSIAAERFGVS